MRHLCQTIAGACALFLMCFPAHSEDRLTVFAAASLKGALDAAAQQSGLDVAVSYGGSGLIARQVAQGAPADVVILAHPDWMAWLTSSGGITPFAEHVLAGNALVLIGPADAPDLTPPVTGNTLMARLASGRLATGLTQSVPAGIYGRQWLMHIDAWSSVRSHLAETDNVRAALALVARSEAPLGLVYASDALAQQDVRVLYAIPSDAHDAIRYPLAVLDTKNTPQAVEFVTFLLSPAGQSLLAEFGFSPVETPS
ncbi:MAG: molybdate ABC transporter substrate-binding protein [Roseovarius sp.]